jgi:hypothetical protein
MPEEILPILIIVAILALVCWAGWRIYCGIVDEPEPETYGDDGGVPHEVCRRAAQKVTRERVRDMPAPETGSGLLAGDKSRRTE